MPKLTTRAVNAKLHKAGYKLALCQGHGYLYFYVPDEFGPEWLASKSRRTDTHSVFVRWLNHLTLEQWLEHAQDAQDAIWSESKSS